MEHHAQYIKDLIARGGPAAEDYESLDRWLSHVANEIDAGRIAREQFDALLAQCGEVFDISTMQGFARRKPHGYAGDFEIIDRIYRRHRATDPHLANWDDYFHAQQAPKAVRNRKTYLLELLATAERLNIRSAFRVLNLASGPARDLSEYLVANGDSRANFTCVEQDQRAIDYAQQLCLAYLDRIEFHCSNVLRYHIAQRYDLIWAAGLFDYFNDRVFRILLKRFYQSVETGGQIVIGNFSPHNQTKHYMELIGDWRLIYRSADQLIRLALECGIPSSAVEIRQEPEGVNLFLHVTKREHT